MKPKQVEAHPAQGDEQLLLTIMLRGKVGSYYDSDTLNQIERFREEVAELTGVAVNKADVRLWGEYWTMYHKSRKGEPVEEYHKDPEDEE